jgi:hypothetical protein
LVKVSDPVLRINQLDTIEHVTDFDSAADHVRTRQKWEEMGVPMMKGMTQMREYDLSAAPPNGAFEVRDDTTSYDTDMGLDEAGLYLKALRKSFPAERAKAEREAFRTTWTEKWEAKKADWAARGWSQGSAEKTLEHFKAFQRTARGKPEQKVALFAERYASSTPLMEEFLAFQKEQSEARKALQDRLDVQQAPESLPFTPFTPPPVDPIVHNTKRWKHDGPWLPGMGADDFIVYLHKEISHRKKDFNAYLVEFVKNEIYTSRRLAASRSGAAPPMDISEAEAWHAEQEKSWRHITPAQITAGIHALRKETANNPLQSKLVSKLVLPFLKLPAIKFKHKAYRQEASSRDIDQYFFDQESAPLSTHPSAGLGYLRTKAYIANHPILGPQASPTPVPARVIQARTTSVSKEHYARLGVAGFVANDQFRSTDTSASSRANISNAQDVETIDINTPGGKKILVQPHFGSVTNDGRIHIKLKRSTGPEIMVARGELDDKPPVRENVEADPLKDLGLGIGRSGVKELDEQSDQAKQFLNALRPQGRAQPPPGFPGVAEALRGD